jgi:gliding motility-associated-like protein
MQQRKTFHPNLAKSNTRKPMNRIILFFFCCFILLDVNPLFSEEPYCKNLGFEMGSFTNWTGYTWLYSTDVTTINTSKVTGIVNRRQTIMKDTTAYDEKTGNQLKIIPSGYKYCARLGDAITNSDTNPRCWNQSLRYSMTVDSANSLLIMKFACVLQYANDHTADMEPRFRLTLFDENNDTIPDCANYDVFSSSTTVDGFKSYTPSGETDPVQWRDWTTVGANLLPYMGKTITVEFMSRDCTGRYHYGYAYFLAQCHPMSIAVKYCAGDTAAVLTAPEGFETYNWIDSTGNTVDSEQILKVENPAEGSVYSCTMTSATGCTVTLNATIVRYEIVADFTSYMLDCASNKVQFTNATTTTNGTLTYEWDFGDSIVSTDKNPQYTFSTSGMHTVGLTIANPPSECTKTLIKDVESFSPPLVGIDGDSTYCPDESVTIKAYGAYQYIWNTGSSADSITISAPGGTYWMMGHSSTGCVSDTSFITIREEPDWEFTTNGITEICDNDTSILEASGATSYLWNTGDTTSSIAVTESGAYKITGANARGCQKSLSFDVVIYPLPNADFYISSTTVDTRHNQLTCNLESATGVQYYWDLGDGSSETGSNITHSYYQVNSALDYTITLTATDQHNCIDSTSKTIDVIPFIPNVFTPNGDGINDTFMAGRETEVFDRNGLKLYNGTEGWDGNFNGQALTPDTYFYLISYTDKNGLLKRIKGFITLTR